MVSEMDYGHNPSVGAILRYLQAPITLTHRLITAPEFKQEPFCFLFNK
jgi:hypothetical protein